MAIVGRKIRVLVIDDSAFVRQVLKQLLSKDPAIEVVGTASDAIAARRLVEQLAPDVLTLDVEMPRMNGLAFLEELMRVRPMPVVMVSSLTEAGCETTLRALELGAVDFVTKPRLDLTRGLPDATPEIVEKVKAAASSRPRPACAVTPPAFRLQPSAGAPRTAAGTTRTARRLLAVGASTGGTEALVVFLRGLPADAPGVVIVQHMPERFTHAFAMRLDTVCAVCVREAADGDRVLEGHVLIAPGGRHLRLSRDDSGYSVKLGSDAPVNYHRPSVDVLFHSCAAAAGSNAVGVILTGMGDDGAQGLLAMRRAGARTLAQDERTCVVFGMPRAAIEVGAVERVLPLESLAGSALALSRGGAAGVT